MSSSDVAPPPVPPKDSSGHEQLGSQDQPTIAISPESPTPTSTASGATAQSPPNQPLVGDGSTAGEELPNYEQSDMSNLTPLELQQLTQNILDESVSDHPLITEVMPIAALRAEYEGGSGSFIRQIDYLSNLGFLGVRRARGDGDCFYRSFAFAYIERLLKARNQTLAVSKAMSLLDSMLPILEASGFQRLVFEDFYDVLASLVRQIVIPEEGGTVLTPVILLEAIQSPEVSNCIVVFLRLITSAIIRTDTEAYAPFLFDPETSIELSPRDFCERYVEAVGKEADHVQMTALSRALKTNIRVAYLDGHSSDGVVSFVDFVNTPPEDCPDPPVLLYRPGHFDLLTTEI